ncbi:MAG: VOC family protein [Alphaproteobacteria bacterium]|nr:VOC family protein [Alphaproteobacteria bacterium]
MSSNRPLDHLVLAVHDLDAAGAFYERLGFLVGARNRHPWGTENRIMQFDGAFLELITVGERAEIAPHHQGVFSFGAFVRDYLKAREGFVMLVLASSDVRADKVAFDKAGIGGFAPFYFARNAKKPDGSEVEVSFSLAFARDPLAPHCGFFVCEQHRPENFWNKAMQAHPNGASALAGVTMVAADPADHAEFLSAFTGIRAFSATSAGLRFETPRGIVECLSNAAFAFDFGIAVPSEGPRLSAFTIGVKDLASFEARLKAEAVAYLSHPNALIIPPHNVFGVVLRFVAA